MSFESPPPSPRPEGFSQVNGVPPAEQPLGKALRGCLSFVWEVLQTLLLAGVLYLGINQATARVRIYGTSMYPTFKSGEFVLVYRWAYHFASPQRGDIVIFHPEAFPGAPRRASQDEYIKRIIGLPGETVTVRDGRVFINNVPIEEPYIAEPPRYRGVWRVPPGQVFVLGDNRNDSTDSHVFGPVPLDRIVGRAVLVYWPPSAWRFFSPPPYPALQPTPSPSP